MFFLKFARRRHQPYRNGRDVNEESEAVTLFSPLNFVHLLVNEIIYHVLIFYIFKDKLIIYVHQEIL
jgi:hypothetical protein